METITISIITMRMNKSKKEMAHSLYNPVVLSVSVQSS
jgi:hypothetical protein